MQNVHVVTNRKSGAYSERNIERISRLLEKYNIQHKTYHPETPEELSEQVRNICSISNHDIIAVAGGDGTLNAAIQGINSSNIIAVIPMGTVNLIAMEIGIKSIEDAIFRISRGHAAFFSAGLATSPLTSRYFVSMLGAGFDAHVVHSVSLSLKNRYGKLAYAKSFFSSINSFNFSSEDIKTIQHGCFSSLVVCSSKYYGGRFMLANNASIFSNHFECVGFKNTNKLKFLQSMARIALKQTANDVARIENVSELNIETSNPIQIDGDACGIHDCKVIKVCNHSRIIT